MGQISEIYQWTWRRLPRTFTFPLIVCFAVLSFIAFLLYPSLCDWGHHQWSWLVPATKGHSPGVIVEWLLSGGREGLRHLVAEGLFHILLVVGGLAVFLLAGWLSYFAAVSAYAKLWRWRIKSLPRRAGASAPPAPCRRPGLLEGYRNIGIILAGGGAKGAYQAGALTAIHEFLREQCALGKVRMIAGSSIGAWNALFWLGDLIGLPSRQPEEQSLLQRWWETVDIKGVVRPVPFVPTRRNYLLSNEPWRESFKRIFADDCAVRKNLESYLHGGRGRMHFYFTRANVEQGALEFVTNRHNFDDVLRQPNLPVEGRPRPPVARSSYEVATSVEEMGEAVFSSMDLPPLFEYSRDRSGRRYYEDGGVVDNLPIRFGTELEKCDLLFVLPLNANFEEEVNLNSVVRRLYRVLNVRQGMLERQALKMVYLYNELAELRRDADRYKVALKVVAELARSQRASGQAQPEAIEQYAEGVLAGGDPQARLGPSPASTSTPGAAECASRRCHDTVTVFSVCPAPKLFIDTASFWKTTEAARAFDLMYWATRDQLDLFDFERKPTWVRMAQISPAGAASYLEDF